MITRGMIEMAALCMFIMAMTLLGYGFGYQIGKSTPCVDEEQFEIHPMK